MLNVRRGQLTFKKLVLERIELEVKFLEMIWNLLVKLEKKLLQWFGCAKVRVN
jgi:hypothetical protein